METEKVLQNPTLLASQPQKKILLESLTAGLLGAQVMQPSTKSSLLASPTRIKVSTCSYAERMSKVSGECTVEVPLKGKCSAARWALQTQERIKISRTEIKK